MNQQSPEWQMEPDKFTEAVTKFGVLLDTFVQHHDLDPGEVFFVVIVAMVMYGKKREESSGFSDTDIQQMLYVATTMLPDLAAAFLKHVIMAGGGGDIEGFFPKDDGDENE